MLPRVSLEYGQVRCASSTSGLGGFALQARQADVEAGAEEVRAVDQRGPPRCRWRGRPEGRSSSCVRQSHRTFEAGRPAGGEQLLGIGADARGTGGRKLDVETAVGAARRAVAAAGGVGLGVYNTLLTWSSCVPF